MLKSLNLNCDIFQNYVWPNWYLCFLFKNFRMFVIFFFFMETLKMFTIFFITIQLGHFKDTWSTFNVGMVLFLLMIDFLIIFEDLLSFLFLRLFRFFDNVCGWINRQNDTSKQWVIPRKIVSDFLENIYVREFWELLF